MRSREELETLASMLVDAVVHVHSALGPGLLESAYQACLAHELECRGVRVEVGVSLPVRYGSITVAAGYRMDLLVDGEIVVENKAVKALAPIHEAQLLTYLKLAGLRLGFLINWNVPRVKDGLKRMVHRL